MSKKISVAIEETRCKTVEIEVPDDVSISDDLEYAMEKAKTMYICQEIILCQDNITTRQISASDENGFASDWNEF